TSWVHPLIDTLFLGQDEVADFDTTHFLNGKGAYLRAQMDIPDSLSALDDPSKIPELIELADDWVAKNYPKFIQVCDKLNVRDNDIYSSEPSNSLSSNL